MPRVTPRAKPLNRTFLRQWREYRHLSQEKAASRMGIDRSLLSKIENGKAQYNQGFLEAASMAYMCEVVDLLIRDPKPTSGLWTLIDAVRKTPQAKQKQIFEVVETLLKSGT
jgi:transcriptional regulator with XRE-family HTH domain